MIATETDEMVLYDFLSLLKEDDALPPQGRRAAHVTTPLVVTAHNRLSQLGAMPYRQYRQQMRLHQVLTEPIDKHPGKTAVTG